MKIINKILIHILLISFVFLSFGCQGINKKSKSTAYTNNNSNNYVKKNKIAELIIDSATIKRLKINNDVSSFLKNNYPFFEDQRVKLFYEIISIDNKLKEYNKLQFELKDTLAKDILIKNAIKINSNKVKLIGKLLELNGEFEHLYAVYITSSQDTISPKINILLEDSNNLIKESIKIKNDLETF